MSYIKIKKIKKEDLEYINPEDGYVYFGYDDETVDALGQGFWMKDEDGEVRYIISVYSTAPSITSFSPSTQCFNNESLTINGTNFILGTTTVKFNGILASIVNVISSNQLTVIVPTNANVVGEVDIVVSTQQYGDSQPVKYIIVEKSMKPIISISPASANVGDTIIITGFNFEAGSTIAYFNNFSGVTTFIDIYNLAVVVPNNTLGSLQLYVKNSYTQSDVKDITINSSTKPTFTGFYPISGYVGDIIHISGTNFTTAQIQVSFGPKSASEITVIDSTYITAKISDNTPFGYTMIRVYDSYLGRFAVLGSPVSLLPTIVGIDPTIGTIGGTVSISGTNLGGNIVVTFSDIECSTISSDDNICYVTINSNVIPGMNSVKVLNEFGISNTYNYEIEYSISGPTITSFSPISESIGSTISIYGTNFNSSTAVYIGNIVARSAYISSTEIRAEIPSGVIMGETNIKVINSTVSYTKGGFTVNSSPYAPVISVVSPVFGKYLDSIDVTGSNLSGCTISFGTSFYNSITGVTTTINNTRCKVIVPSGIVSNGDDKIVNIYAKNTNGNCVYLPFNLFSVPSVLPSLYSFLPDVGVTGTTVSVTGTGFAKFWTDLYVSILSGGTTKYLLMDSQYYVDNETVVGSIPYAYDYIGSSSIKVVTPNGESQKSPFNLVNIAPTTTTTTIPPTTTTTTTPLTPTSTTTTTPITPTTTTTTTPAVFPLAVDMLVGPLIITLEISGGVPPYSYDMHFSSSNCGTINFIPVSDTTSDTTIDVSYSDSQVDSVYTITVDVTDSLNTSVSYTSDVFTKCLVPETLILMSDNTEKQLKDINVGDKVLTLDTNFNLIETIITHTKLHIVNMIFDINNGLLKSSESHRYIIKINNELIITTASELKIGDILIDYNGNDVIINSINNISGEQDVINISTESQTYIANGILTHNKNNC